MSAKKTKDTVARRRRHLGVALTDQGSLGQKLQEFRRTHGLLQDELAQQLGLNQRIISRIETGTRQMQPAELAKFRKVFEIDLETVHVPKATAAAPLALNDNEYLDAQAQLIMGGPKPPGAYSLWILNPESLPMLESNRFTHAWAENLTDYSFDYHTVWILDFTVREELRRFVRRVSEVAKLAHAMGWKKQQGGRVYLHALRLPDEHAASSLSRKKPEIDLVSEYYEKLRQDRPTLPSAEDQDPEADLLVMDKERRLNMRENLDLPLFLLRFYFDPACVIAYKPSPLSLVDKPLVAVGLKDVIRYSEPRSERAFSFLGDASVDRFMTHIDRLEDLFKEDLP